MAFLGELTTTLVADGVGRLLARVRGVVGGWVRRHVRWGKALRQTDARIMQLRESLFAASGALERVRDHLLQLDQAGLAFDAHKVLIETHTKGLFKLPQPLITASVQETNMLRISCGRSTGAIAGVCLSIVSKNGKFHAQYVLRDADIRDGYLCIRPPSLDLRMVNPEDLIVSFVQAADLSPGERALSLLLDEIGSNVIQIRSVLMALQR